MKALWASLALLAVIATQARADRPVTDDERKLLVAAVTTQGCTGGELEWDEDDREFEVDNARCSDGRKYDLKFHSDFTLKSKKLDDD